MTTAPAPIGTAPVLAEDVQRRGMHAAILSACWKVVTSLTFTNGLMLLFLFLFLFRDLTGLPLVVALGIIHVLFGLPQSASSIAISTEMLALIPARRRSLTTSLCHTFYMAGIAGSGVLVAWGLRLGLFANEWTLFGQARGACDAVLLVCAVLIMTMTVTLGLVPSVIGKPQQLGREV